jgi:hypothetical protein
MRRSDPDIRPTLTVLHHDVKTDDAPRDLGDTAEVSDTECGEEDSFVLPPEMTSMEREQREPTRREFKVMPRRPNTTSAMALASTVSLPTAIKASPYPRFQFNRSRGIVTGPLSASSSTIKIPTKSLTPSSSSDDPFLDNPLENCEPARLDGLSSGPRFQLQAYASTVRIDRRLDKKRSFDALLSVQTNRAYGDKKRIRAVPQGPTNLRQISVVTDLK